RPQEARWGALARPDAAVCESGRTLVASRRRLSRVPEDECLLIAIRRAGRAQEQPSPAVLRWIYTAALLITNYRLLRRRAIYSGAFRCYSRHPSRAVRPAD